MNKPGQPGIGEAIIGIGVFTDNRVTYEWGVKMWRGPRARCHLSEDGRPRAARRSRMRPRDFGATKASLPEFVDGLPRETARDSQHANMAFAGMVNAAETAPHRGRV